MHLPDLDGSCAFCVPGGMVLGPVVARTSGVELERSWSRDGANWTLELRAVTSLQLGSWGMDWQLPDALGDPQQVEFFDGGALSTAWNQRQGRLRVGVLAGAPSYRAPGDVILRATWSGESGRIAVPRLEGGVDDLAGAIVVGDSDPNQDISPARPGRTTVIATPNPFNPRTTFAVFVPSGRDVGNPVIEIHDSRGRQVRRLLVEGIAGAWVDAVWDGRDDEGREVASGIYLARVRGVSDPTTVKVGLIR